MGEFVEKNLSFWKFQHFRNFQDSNPVILPEKNVSVTKKSGPKNVTCTKTTAYFLFFIALASIVLSSFITYWVTKGIYDRSLEIRPLADEHSMAWVHLILEM